VTVWAERDEPVLRFLNEQPPADGILWTNWLSEQPHADVPALTEAQFERAIETLHDAGYVTWEYQEGEGSGGRFRQGFFVTGAGKQVLGDWPRFDALGQPQELATLLDALADLAPTEEEASNYRRAAGVLRRVAPGVLSALMKGALGAVVRGTLA
jgi:hypothetical protein